MIWKNKLKILKDDDGGFGKIKEQKKRNWE